MADISPCWRCKAARKNRNLTGLCHDCREAIGEGLQTILFDGTPCTFNRALIEKVPADVVSIKAHYSSTRFADDTGWYHQFNGGGNAIQPGTNP